jgi:hypothetical protein
LGLSVSDIRESCEFDLTRQFGFWISRRLHHAAYGRVICTEISHRTDPEEVIEKIAVAIALLEAVNIEARSVAMAVLFAGLLRMPPKRIATALVPMAERILSRARWLERVLFVEKDDTRAQALDRAFDSVLGRAHLVLPQKSLIRGLKTDILNAIAEGEQYVPEGHLRLVSEMREALSARKLRAVDLGILARRVVEFIANDILGESNTTPDMFSRIDKLSEKRVANWIQSYMHVLRTLGNEAAHEKNTYGRRPPSVQEADLIICLLCIHRLWGFWVEWRRHGANKS